MSYKSLPLILILILAFFLRVYQLGVAPKGVHADEMSFIINTQSLLQTGKDEDGRRWPLHLYSFIDPKPALYSYLQLPFFAILGPSTFSSRLPSVLLGVISIALIYSLVRQLITRRTAVATAFLMALSPWHILNSRATQEVMLSWVLVLAAVLLVLQYWRNHKLNVSQEVGLLLGIGLTSFLAMDSYHSAKIFLPLLVASWLGWELWRHFNRAPGFKFLKVMGVMVAMGGLSFAQSGSTARFESVGMLSNPEPQLILEEQIRKGTTATPGLLLRVFYNKATFYGRSFIDTYAQHFTVDFLFLSGGQPLRYKIPHHGLLLWPELLLLPLGVVLLFKDRQHRSYRVLVMLILLLAPVPAALTFIETPSAIRTFPMVLSFTLLSVIALEWLWQQRQSLMVKGVIVIVLGAYGWSLSYFAQQLLVQQPVFQPWHRNSPYEEIARIVKEKGGEYDRIVVTNDLRPLYSYFVYEGLISYQILHTHPLLRNQETYSLGRFTFNRQICNFGPHQPKTLYIGEINCYPDGRAAVATVTYDDGFPVYGIWAE